MSDLTLDFSKSQLNGITGAAQLTTPTTTYLALFSEDPTDAGSVNGEINKQGYARKSLSGAFTLARSTSVSNSAEIKFDLATEDWGVITHIGIMGSGVKGTADMLMVIPLDTSITILNTQTFKFDIGALTISAGCPVAEFA